MTSLSFVVTIATRRKGVEVKNRTMFSAPEGGQLNNGYSNGGEMKGNWNEKGRSIKSTRNNLIKFYMSSRCHKWGDYNETSQSNKVNTFAEKVTLAISAFVILIVYADFIQNLWQKLYSFKINKSFYATTNTYNSYLRFRKLRMISA